MSQHVPVFSPAFVFDPYVVLPIVQKVLNIVLVSALDSIREEEQQVVPLAVLFFHFAINIQRTCFLDSISLYLRDYSPVHFFCQKSIVLRLLAASGNQPDCVI